MPQLVPLSFTEQVASHLRQEIARGIWTREMPGAPNLAKELNVDPKTVLAALKLLEREKVLIPQGAGKRRRINHGGIDSSSTTPLRIAIMPYDALDASVNYYVELQHNLAMAGHRVFYTSRTVQDFGTDLKRLERFVSAEKADAWIVISGSRRLLEWFAQSRHHAFAAFGCCDGLPIAAAAAEKRPIYRQMVDRLVELGHRRISLLVREDRRIPAPGPTESAFLERLEHHGITTSAYNLPEWRDGRDPFHEMLSGLFRVTPPTALITQEVFVFNAVYHYLSQSGLRVPQDVSLACTDHDGSFMWCDPPVSQIFWSSMPITRRVVRWAANISRGQTDLRQSVSKAKWIEGGTIGPVRSGGNTSASLATRPRH